MIEVLEKLTELLRKGRTVAVASIVATSGCTPRAAGAKMLVTPDGETHFTIGGGGFEAAVAEDAKRAIEEGRNRIKEYGHTGDAKGSVGICGGKTTVVIEVVSPPQRLVVFGAGHVGKALTETAQGLGLNISVVDDRADLLTLGSLPEGVTPHLTSPDYDRDIPELGENTYVAIVTRSHETDLKALRYVIERKTAYVGMMGSRKKVKEVFGRLRANGVSGETLDRVHAPIGMEIGSKTPKETAISILAEIIRVRNRGSSEPKLRGAGER